jgi:methylase of polypeptide subunit release factors
MEFGPIVVAFDGRVLRPRPWTLLQATWAAELHPTLPAGPMLELCAGAGHIGQAAAALTGRSLVQVDVDPHACALSTANASSNGLGGVVRVVRADLGRWSIAERFPLVLADPPYLPREEAAAWPDDPAVAIDGGEDGLELPRRCVAAAARHLRAGGAVLLQAAGAAQVEALAPDVAAAGLSVVEVRSEDDRRAVALLRPA